MPFKKGKCQIFHFSYSKPIQQYRLGEEWVESYLAEKDLRVLVSNQVNMSEQHSQAAKEANSLVCIRNSIVSTIMEVIITLYSALVRLHLRYWVWFWVPRYKKGFNYWNAFTKEQQS